jgi:hypothetical protein
MSLMFYFRELLCVLFNPNSLPLIKPHIWFPFQFLHTNIFRRSSLQSFNYTQIIGFGEGCKGVRSFLIPNLTSLLTESIQMVNEIPSLMSGVILLTVYSWSLKLLWSTLYLTGWPWLPFYYLMTGKCLTVNSWPYYLLTDRLSYLVLL